MSFAEAVSAVFSKYATFSGRARRSEFWWFALFSFIANIVAAMIDGALGLHLVQPLYSLGVLLPSLAVGARRLHDIGRSGWWMLIVVIPLVGWIIAIIWYAKEGTPGTNEYGPAV
jgi:uncharacterized membrane protein YhaH (DUF805 family)